MLLSTHIRTLLCNELVVRHWWKLQKSISGRGMHSVDMLTYDYDVMTSSGFLYCDFNIDSHIPVTRSF